MLNAMRWTGRCSFGSFTFHTLTTRRGWRDLGSGTYTLLQRNVLYNFRKFSHSGICVVSGWRSLFLLTTLRCRRLFRQRRLESSNCITASDAHEPSQHLRRKNGRTKLFSILLDHFRRVAVVRSNVFNFKRTVKNFPRS